MDNDAIEASLAVPDSIADSMFAEKSAQDDARGDWPSPRDARQPDAPWPGQDSATLRYLLWKARASLDAGMDRDAALLQLAVHAWFEGGIEGYDRGRRDGQKLRAVP